MFILRIDTANAAFEGDNLGPEREVHCARCRQPITQPVLAPDSPGGEVCAECEGETAHREDGGYNVR